MTEPQMPEGYDPDDWKLLRNGVDPNDNSKVADRPAADN